MSNIIQELTINNYNIKECEGVHLSLVYVDDKMVTTNWEDTIKLIENEKPLEYENEIDAMHRVLSSLGIRQ